MHPRRNASIRRKVNKINHTPSKKKLELSEYDKLFPMENDNSGKSVREKAFERAWKVRDFEIKLYWERAKYFWAFIATTFAGYFVSLGSAYEKFPELPFIVVIIGIIFSLAWTLVNIGSKNWQRNWESHIDRLEENFTGPLYRTVLSFKNYSVSRVNIITSIFIMIIWSLLGISFFIKNKDCLNWFIITFSLVTLIIFSWILLVFSQTGRSRKKNIFKIRELK